MQMENRTTPITDHHAALVEARLKMQGDRAHCLEMICEKNGVQWINHSMATSIDMTWFALRDVPGPVTLIIGGIDRAEDHHKLNQLVSEKVRTVICLGSTPWKYFNAWQNKANLVVRAGDLQEAIEFAEMLSKQEVRSILFSPSCPSFDAFDNYKNRGNAFRRMVLENIAGQKLNSNS